MKNKTILVSFSLILLGSGLFFVIKYFLKFQSLAPLIANKTEMSSVAVQSSTSSPEYVLDQMFAKDHWPHSFDPNKPIITDTVEGIIIRNENIKIFEKTIAASSSLLRYNVTQTYPQFSGFSNVLNEEKLNKRIEGEVKKKLKAFQSEVKGRVNFNLPPFNNNSLSWMWDIYVSKNEMVSMRLTSLEGYETMRGVARSTLSFSYDMVSGQELFLKDFFIPGSDFITRMRKVVLVENYDRYDQDQFNFYGEGSNFTYVFGKSSKETEDALECLMIERGVVCGYDHDFSSPYFFEGFSIEWKDLEDILNLEVMNRIRE